VPICRATAAGTPCWRRPAVSVVGRLLASPAIISEKKIPIDSELPEFWNVDRIPEATPRCRAGTLLISADVFGAANMPRPTPFAAMISAKHQYGKSTGSSIRPTKVPATTSIPALAKPRAPNRSERNPDTGPETRNPADSGSMKMPAHRGVSA